MPGSRAADNGLLAARQCERESLTNTRRRAPGCMKEGTPLEAEHAGAIAPMLSRSRSRARRLAVDAESRRRDGPSSGAPSASRSPRSCAVRRVRPRRNGRAPPPRDRHFPTSEARRASTPSTPCDDLGADRRLTLSRARLREARHRLAQADARRLHRWVACRRAPQHLAAVANRRPGRKQNPHGHQADDPRPTPPSRPAHAGALSPLSREAASVTPLSVTSPLCLSPAPTPSTPPHSWPT